MKPRWHFCVVFLSLMEATSAKRIKVANGNAGNSNFEIDLDVRGKKSPISAEITLDFCVGKYAMDTVHSQCTSGLLVCVERNGRDLDLKKYDNSKFKQCGDLATHSAFNVSTKFESGWFSNDLWFQVSSPSTDININKAGHELPTITIPVTDKMLNEDVYCIRVGTKSKQITTIDGTLLASFNHFEDVQASFDSANPGLSLAFTVYSESKCQMSLYFDSSDRLDCNTEKELLTTCTGGADHWESCVKQLVRPNGGFTVIRNGATEYKRPFAFIQNAMRNVIRVDHGFPAKAFAIQEFGKASKEVSVLALFVPPGVIYKVYTHDVICMVNQKEKAVYDTGLYSLEVGGKEVGKVYLP